MVKKTSKSGNNGLPDKDLWQFVTRSVKPYGKKPAAAKPQPPKAPAREKPPVTRQSLPFRPPPAPG